MKRMFWQREWLGIYFSDLDITLNFFKGVSSDFYSKFYSELFCRYNSYEDLPSFWCQEKKRTANEIAKIISEESLVLSCGCGLGFVEKEIVSQLNKLSIDAYDFSETSSKWLRDVDRVNIMQSLEKNKKYNFIYSTQLFYALSNDEIFEFSTMLKEKLFRGGKFLTVDQSVNPIENGIEVSSEIKSIKFHLKNIVHTFISTGMTTYGDIQSAVEIFRKADCSFEPLLEKKTISQRVKNYLITGPMARTSRH